MCPHCSAVQLVHKLLAAKVSENPLSVSSRSTDGLWGHTKSPHVASNHLATEAHRPGVFLSALHSIPHNPPCSLSSASTSKASDFFLANHSFSDILCHDLTPPAPTMDSYTLFPGKESGYASFLQAHLCRDHAYSYWALRSSCFIFQVWLAFFLSPVLRVICFPRVTQASP